MNENHSEITKNLMSHLIIFQYVAGSFLYDKDRLIGMGLSSSNLQGYVFAFVNIGSFKSDIDDALAKFPE